MTKKCLHKTKIFQICETKSTRAKKGDQPFYLQFKEVLKGTKGTKSKGYNINHKLLVLKKIIIRYYDTRNTFSDLQIICMEITWICF